MRSCMMKFVQEVACQYAQVRGANLYNPPHLYMHMWQIEIVSVSDASI